MTITPPHRLNVSRPLAAALFDHAASTPDSAAVYLPNGLATRNVAWCELAADVMRMVALIERHGIEAGDRIEIWSDNRYEWIVSDLAIQLLGAVSVPIHGALSEPLAAAQIAHSEPRLALVANAALADGLKRHSQETLRGLPIVFFDAAADEPALLERLMSCSADEGRQIIEQRAAAFDPGSIATILYSSGTSGEPKAVALTHDNLGSNARAVIEGLQESASERRMNFLPFSHIYARTCDLYAWLLGGSQLVLARSRDTVVDDCRLTQPTLINGVPFFYQRIAQKVAAAEAVGDGVTLQRLFGGKLRIGICGGAALPVATFDFYQQRGVMLLPGYGLTESSPVIALSSPMAFRRGAVGKAIPGIEVRIAEDGELLTRGPHVMKEYWKDAELTRQTIRDGWLYTGDLGAIDADGYISITGRKKELIVLSTGKKAVPTLIEGLLLHEPLIQQAMVFGNDQPCLAALVVPNHDLLDAWASGQGLPELTRDEAIVHPSVVRLYAERIGSLLAALPNYEQVKRFLLLDRAFTIDAGHLTPKQSLRRDVLNRDFSADMAALYAGGGAAVDYSRDTSPQQVGVPLCDTA
jgi:long-chain acyl-CoA synthetase